MKNIPRHKVHVKGTNNRTMCGNKINELTKTSNNDFDVTCLRCLGRLHGTSVDVFLTLQKVRNMVINDTYGVQLEDSEVFKYFIKLENKK